MENKEITVVFCSRHYHRNDWKVNIDEAAIETFLAQITQEMATYGVTLHNVVDDGMVVVINSYGDILNSVRLRSPKNGIGNLGLGHVIGTSPNCDLIEDLRRGINRVAFAPETIEPEDHNKIVCHDCGCGC